MGNARRPADPAQPGPAVRAHVRDGAGLESVSQGDRRDAGGCCLIDAGLIPISSMRAVPGHVPLLATMRGRTIECVHHGSIAVCDLRGDLVAGAGDVQALNFARSTLKPLQALPFIEDDGPARFGFGSHEVALMCAS